MTTKHPAVQLTPRRVQAAETSASPLLIMILLAAPYIFLRQYWDDYSQGTSFTLVDALLCLAGLKLFLTRRRLFAPGLSARLLLAGAAFVCVALASGLEGSSLYDVDVSIPALLSGTFQYAFVLLVLPFLAAHRITIGNLRSVLRYIALAYFVPMVLALMFLPHTAPERLREVFYFSNRALGAYGNPNTFSGMLAMTFCFYGYLALTDRGRWRLLGRLGIVLSLVCMFLAVSFSGALTLICVVVSNLLAALFWKEHPVHRYRRRFAGLALSTLLLTSAVFLAGTRNLPSILDDVSARLAVFQQPEVSRIDVRDLGSGRDRLELMRLAFDLIDARHGGFFSGHGLRQTQELRQFSFAGVHQEVHQIYLLLWIEGGLVFALIYVGYLGLLLKNVTALARGYPAEGVALGSALVGLIAFGLFNPHVYMRFFWMPLLPAFVDWREAVRARYEAPGGRENAAVG